MIQISGVKDFDKLFTSMFFLCLARFIAWTPPAATLTQLAHSGRCGTGHEDSVAALCQTPLPYCYCHHKDAPSQLMKVEMKMEGKGGQK